MSPPSFLPASSIIRSAPSLRRVPWGRFPDLSGTIRRLRLLASPRASLRLLRSALPPPRPRSLPHGRTTPREPGPLLPRRTRRLPSVERPGRRGHCCAPPPTETERARLTHSVPHLAGSLKNVRHARGYVTDGRGYRLSSSFIRSQFMRRRRRRRASHLRQMRATWKRNHSRRLPFPVRP